MARISRACYESCYFHVMVQGIAKEYIFKENELKEKYIDFLNDAIKENSVKIIAYCIMDNHVHLLLYTLKISNLTSVMASVNTRYAKYYNKTLQRCGYVYRDRYRCENIMTQSHLENCIRYIHNNPVEANICEKPSRYKYSSYNKFKNKLVDKEILKLISWDENTYLEKLDSNVADYNFLEINNEFGQIKYEKIDKVFEEYSKKDFNDDKTVYEVQKQLKKRCNATNEEIIKLMKLKRSSFYNIIKRCKALDF